MSNVVTLPLSELIEDLSIYPRHAVDGAHVQSLVMALEAHATLPPIRVCNKSRRISDGWHRYRAHKRVNGPDSTIEVELVDYKDEAALKLDAVACNSRHGRRLDSIDRIRAVIMLRDVGCTDRKIADALGVPERRVELLSIRVARVPASSEQAIPNTKTMALKRCVGHMEGKTLTRSQAEAHSMLPGTQFILLAKQLCEALREGMVNLEDEKLVAQLVELGKLIRTKLPLVHVERQ